MNKMLMKIKTRKHKRELRETIHAWEKLLEPALNKLLENRETIISRLRISEMVIVEYEKYLKQSVLTEEDINDILELSKQMDLDISDELVNLDI